MLGLVYGNVHHYRALHSTIIDFLESINTLVLILLIFCDFIDHGMIDIV